MVRVSQTLKPFTPLCRKCQEADMAPKHSTLKRPAAALSIKSEPKSPKVPKRQPEMAAESPPPEKPEVAAESPPPEKPEVAAVEKAEMSAGPTGADKPVVAKGRTRKPKNGELPAPGKEAWKDVHTQVMKLQKQGKGALRNAWEKAKQEGSQQAKRDFYYNVFLLDPAVSKKEVHKESLERLQEKETTTKGWMTQFQVGVLQGADPQDPAFKDLCEAACEGLPERPHEVKKWADKGIKQYYVSKQLNSEESRIKESTTTAKHSVDDLDESNFENVEQALAVKPDSKQFLLTNKKASDGSKKPEVADEEGEEATPEEQYSAAYKGAKKAIAAVGAALDKASFLLKTLEQKQKHEPTAQLKSSTEELKKVETEGTKAKNSFLQKLSSFKVTLEQPEMAESLCGKLNDLQKECEEATKAMNKGQSHHRLWARNAGLI